MLKSLKITRAEHKTSSKYAVKLMKNLKLKAQLTLLPQSVCFSKYFTEQVG